MSQTVDHNEHISSQDSSVRAIDSQGHKTSPSNGKHHSIPPRGSAGKGPGKQTHTFQPERPSQTSWKFYLIVGGSVLVVTIAALYISMTTKKSWAPVADAGTQIETTPVIIAAAPSVEIPKPVAPPVAPRKEVPQPSLAPNATIDVPGVGLRANPDISVKAVASGLKRGEKVEIVKRVSGKGPAWVKIKTKSGKTGWVFASVVKEMKRG